MFEQAGPVGPNMAAFLIEKMRNRLAKLRMRDPVARPGQGRQESMP